MDKMREEFEAWVVSESERTGYAYMDKVLSKFGESYTTTWVDSSWQGWKASRSALCVSLPETRNADEGNYKEGVMISLDKAGVSYK